MLPEEIQKDLSLCYSNSVPHYSLLQIIVRVFTLTMVRVRVRVRGRGRSRGKGRGRGRGRVGFLLSKNQSKTVGIQRFHFFSHLFAFSSHFYSWPIIFFNLQVAYQFL